MGLQKNFLKSLNLNRKFEITHIMRRNAHSNAMEMLIRLTYNPLPKYDSDEQVISLTPDWIVNKLFTLISIGIFLQCHEMKRSLPIVNSKIINVLEFSWHTHFIETIFHHHFANFRSQNIKLNYAFLYDYTKLEINVHLKVIFANCALQQNKYNLTLCWVSFYQVLKHSLCIRDKIILQYCKIHSKATQFMYRPL